MARAIEPYDLFWVEIDTRDPKAPQYIRRGTTIPVASGECLFGRRDYRPFFEQQGMDIAIIDTPWKRCRRVPEDPPPWRMFTRSMSRRTTSTATWRP